MALFQRSNTREARSTARSKVHVREGQVMTLPQIHQPLSSFVSLAKRSSLGTRNSVPERNTSGLISIIQNGNTDTMSMSNMPVERRVVVLVKIWGENGSNGKSPISSPVECTWSLIVNSDCLSRPLALTFDIFPGRGFAGILHRLEHGRVWV